MAKKKVELKPKAKAKASRITEIRRFEDTGTAKIYLADGTMRPVGRKWLDDYKPTTNDSLLVVDGVITFVPE